MSGGENLKRILRLLAPYKLKQVQTFLCMTVNVTLGLLLPLIIRFLIDDVIREKKPDLLVPLVLATLGVFCASAVFGFLTTYLSNVVGQNIVRDMRKRLFDHMTKLPFRFFTDQGTGRIMSRVLNDVSTIGMVVSSILLDFLMNSLMVVGYFSVMSYFHWRLTLLSFTTVPLYVILVRFFNKRLQKTSYLTMSKHAEVSSSLQESISGIREIRSFSREASEGDKFHFKLMDFLKARIRLTVLTGGSVHLAVLISSIATLLVIWYGGSLVLRGVISLGTLIAMWAYLGQLFNPIRTLMTVNVRFQEAAAAFTRIDEITSVPPAIKEKPGATRLIEPKGSIEFDDVSFSYDVKPVVEHLDLRIAEGELVAIVGGSGSGKTTIANLIMRFFDPDRGSVRLDGIDLRELRVSDLRQSVALVSQETFLFNASIEANISFGLEGASEGDVARAADIAGVSDFAKDLPEGLRTMVGERGVSISGGERQRIALARAILRNPAVLVLDEATSQLDSRAESKLRTTLNQVMKGRTSVMIAHRLSTISGAERILVLDDGRIAEEGTHQSLMGKRGIYYSLYEEQAKL